MTTQHQQSGGRDDSRRKDAGPDRSRRVQPPIHAETFGEAAGSIEEPAALAPPVPDQRWAEAPLGELRRLLSERANDWFALLPITSAGRVEFESRPDPHDILPEERHDSWDAFEQCLRSNVAMSIAIQGLVADQRFQHMQRHGYRLVVAASLAFLDELKKEGDPTSHFENACIQAVYRLITEFPAIVESSEVMRPPLPDNAFVAFWDRLTIWSATHNEKRPQPERSITDLSDDDRVQLMRQLARNDLYDLPGHPDLSVPAAIESLAKFDRYASVVRDEILPHLPRLSEMLELLADKDSSPEEKETLVRLLQTTVPLLNAELTLNGQPCGIYFLPPNQDYRSGRYRVRLKSSDKDALARVKFPPGLGIKLRGSQ